MEPKHLAFLAAPILIACSPQKQQKSAAPLKSKPAAMELPQWEYTTDTDHMRSQTTFYASLRSSNWPMLDSPFQGGSPLTMMLFKTNGTNHPDRADPTLMLANGQFGCTSDDYAGACHISIKADDGPVLTMIGRESDCGALKCLGLEIGLDERYKHKSLLPLIRTAKIVTIEVPIYGFGSYQYSFHTQGLKWSQEADRQ